MLNNFINAVDQIKTISEKLHFYAVFDGHGGSLAAEFCMNR